MLVYRVSEADESRLVGVVAIADEADPLLLGQLLVEEAVPYAVRDEREFEDTFLGRPPGRLEARLRGAALEPGPKIGAGVRPVSGQA